MSLEQNRERHNDDLAAVNLGEVNDGCRMQD